MTTFHFQTHISADGTVLIPRIPELPDKDVLVVVIPQTQNVHRDKAEPSRRQQELTDSQFLEIARHNEKFWHPQTLDDILQEQNAKVVQSIDELIPKEAVWESEEEFFAFLEAIGENLNVYRHE